MNSLPSFCLNRDRKSPPSPTHEPRGYESHPQPTWTPSVTSAKTADAHRKLGAANPLIRCWQALCVAVVSWAVVNWMVGTTAVVMGQGVLWQDDQSYRLPRPDRPPANLSYRVKELAIDANVVNQIATTQVTQVFENTGSAQIEAQFVFPLPYDGAVDQLTFLVDGKEIVAELLPKDQARKIYEGYLRRNQDPALLEWMGKGLYRSSVFPIPVGQSRTVTLRFSQLLRKDQKIIDYEFPLATAKYSSQAVEKVSFRVAIAADEDVKSVYSPTHDIQIERADGRHLVVRYQGENVTPNRDFRLFYDTAGEGIGASVLSYWPNDEDQGYYALLASPEFRSVDEQSTVPKTVIFVVDQSGSMSGEKINQAREAVKFVLQNLRENDLFNVIRYESSVTALSPELLRYSEETRQQALGFAQGIQAGGGTNIAGALQRAMSQIQTKENPAYVVFLTDGLPTIGETNELKIAESCRTSNQHNARLLSFGVGYDVNARLLDRLTRENKGQSLFVLPSENIETAVANLYRKISSPVLNNVNVAYQFEGRTVAEGEPVNRVYPKDPTDLFSGSQLVILGRYTAAGPAKITISGEARGESKSWEIPVNFAARGATSGYPFVRQIWAARRIGEIIDLLDLQGHNQELVQELVALSIRHGIVTPYTSYLADENESREQLANSQRNLLSATERLERLNEVSGAEGLFQRSNKQALRQNDGLGGLDMAAADYSANVPDTAGAGGGGSVGTRLRIAGARNSPQVSGGAGTGSAPQRPGGVRRVGDQTLYVRGNLLVADNATDVDVSQSTEVIKLKRFSPEYFQLLEANTESENLLLAQQRESEELLIRLRSQVYLIQ